MRRFATMAALPMCLLALDAVAEKEGNWARDYYTELSVSSSPYSLGSVSASRWVCYLEGDVVQSLSSFGHVLLGYWSLSDLEKSRDRTHRAHVYESDPYLFYGYDWDFAEGWRWRNRVGIIWVFNEGYKEEVRHLFREWTYMGELQSPYATVFGQTRVVDDLGTYVRVGVQRSFTLVDGVVSVTPHAALHGGSTTWNRRRYGDYAEERAIGQGLKTAEYGLKFHGPLERGVGWFVDFAGFDALDARTRTQIRASRAHGSTRKLDAFFVYSGLTWEF